MARCHWCNTDQEESKDIHEGPHATWCPEYQRPIQPVYPIRCTGPDCPLCKTHRIAKCKVSVAVIDTKSGKEKLMYISYGQYWQLLMAAGYWDSIKEAYPQGAD